jgi:hypothetical protein
MKFLSKLLGLLMTVQILAACKKDLPPLPDSPNPVFVATGTIDGQEISMQAGVGNYLMHSEQWLWNDVPVYRGSISNGSSQFQLDWYSGDVWKLAADLQYILSQTNLSCVTTPENPLSLNAASCANSSAFSSFLFKLNNGIEQQTVSFSEPGIWEVSCAGVQLNEMQTSLTNKVVIGYNSKSLFRLQASQVGNLVYAHLSESTQAVDSVQWSMGNFTSTTTELNTELPVNTGSHILNAKVYFANGVIRHRQIAVAMGDREAISDYVYGLEQSWFNYFDWKVGLIVQLGQEVYETRSVTQNQPVQLTVKAKSLYTDPTSQQQVIKMDFDLTAQFRKMSSGELVQGNFTVSLALPIPE